MYCALCVEVPLWGVELQSPQPVFRYADHWAAMGFNLRMFCRQSDRGSIRFGSCGEIYRSKCVNDRRSFSN